MIKKQTEIINQIIESKFTLEQLKTIRSYLNKEIELIHKHNNVYFDEVL